MEKRERTMQWRERKVKHIERFFLARAADGTIDTSGLDERGEELDGRSITAGGSAGEIAASSERFEPRDIAARLKALLRDGPPAEPVDLSVVS